MGRIGTIPSGSINIRVVTRGDLSLLSANIPALLNEVILKAGRKTDNILKKWETRAKELAPEDTGYLKSTISKGKIQRSGNTIGWELIASAPYAKAWELGFTEHPILTTFRNRADSRFSQFMWQRLNAKFGTTFSANDNVWIEVGKRKNKQPFMVPAFKEIRKTELNKGAFTDFIESERFDIVKKTIGRFEKKMMELVR